MVQKSHPYDTSSLMKRAFLWWVIPIMKISASRRIEKSDIPWTPRSLQSLRISKSFRKYCSTAKLIAEGPVQLIKAFLRTFAYEWFVLVLCVSLQEIVCNTTLPLLIYALTNFFIDGDEDFSNGVLYTFGLCFVIMMSMVFNSLHYFFANVMGLKIRVVFSYLIFNKILKLNHKSTMKVRSGHVINLLSNDILKFDMLMSSISYLWIAPIQMIIVGYLIYSQAGPICLIAIIVYALNITLQMLMSRQYAMLREKTMRATDKRSTLMNEIITGINVIKMYTWEKSLANELAKLRLKEYRLLKSANLRRSFNSGLHFMSERLIMVIIMTIYVVQNGEIFEGRQFFYIMSLVNVIRMSVTCYLPPAFSSGSEAWASTKRIHEFLIMDEFDRQKDIPGETNLISKGCAVRLEDLTTSWSEQDSPILKNISLKVKSGDLVLVTGTVGSGKSCLLSSLLGDIPKIEGKMFVNGVFSYAAQEPCIFPSTIRENIVFGQSFDQERYENVLQACNLKKDLDMFPAGDRSVVGERGILLSGGQKARIGLARAIYYDADIYLLDDPLSAVDVKVSKSIFRKCLKTFLHGKTIILSTHQLQYLNQASKIVILEKGKTMFKGTYNQLESEKSCSLNFQNYLNKIESSADKVDGDCDQSEHPKQCASIVDNQEFNDECEQKEHREIGTVNWKVYLKFVTAGAGYFGAFFIIFLNTVSYIMYMYSGYLLSLWMDTETEHSIQRSTAFSIVSNDTTIVKNFQSARMAWYILFVVVSAVGSVLLALSAVCNYLICTMSARNLHDRTFLKLLHSPMIFFHQNSVGRIQNRFTKDIGQVDGLMPSVFNEVLLLAMQMMIIVFFVGAVNFIILIPTIVLFGSSLWIKKLYLPSLRDVKRFEATTKSPVFEHVSTTLYSMPTIRAFRAEAEFSKKFDDLQDLNSTCSFMVIGTNRWFAQTIDILALVCVSIVAFSCLFLSKNISSGGLTFALLQTMMLASDLQYFLRQLAELESQMVSVERILEYGKLKTENLDSTDMSLKLKNNWPMSGDLVFKDMFLKYRPKGPYVLKDISCHIQGSQKIGIVGRTGAGKSSIITALFRLYEPEGHIEIDSIPIKLLGLHGLRCKISIIPQDPLLFTNTIRYNLDPFGKLSDKKLWQALKQVHLKKKIASQPEGLLSQVTEGGSNYSVGEKQLICLARALLRENKILILDEATANVDFRTDELIQQTIRKVFKKCTVLTIAHRLETIFDSDKVLVLQNGKICEFDEPANLLGDVNSTFYSMVKESGVNFRVKILKSTMIK